MKNNGKLYNYYITISWRQGTGKTYKIQVILKTAGDKVWEIHEIQVI